MDIPLSPTPKKGLGALGWLGIGCGGVVALAILAVVIFSSIYSDQIKQFADEMQKNPTRAAANAMITIGAGQFEMVAEDDVNKRYTVREKKGGKLTTIYWDAKKNAPEVIAGDFSAIPANSSPPDPAPPAPEPK